MARTAERAAFVAAIAAAARELGLPPAPVAAQAAHETRWGESKLYLASLNAFNIKAGSSWHGPVISRDALEYVRGSARNVRSAFRKYGSIRESVADYAGLLARRYAAALNALQRGDVSGWANGLVAGGYATDPTYATRLVDTTNTIMRDYAGEMGAAAPASSTPGKRVSAWWFFLVPASIYFLRHAHGTETVPPNVGAPRPETTTGSSGSGALNAQRRTGRARRTARTTATR